MACNTLRGENAKELTGDGRQNYVKSVGRELGFVKPLKGKKSKSN